jgi:mannose-6-phosphate isomerase-like protein (cupin superfamily)
MTEQPRWVYDFESVTYARGLAHGGAAEIAFSRHLTCESGAPYNFVDFVRVPPGADIGCHTHGYDNQEMYVIVSGRGRMTLEGVELDVGPGALVVNRPGGTHSLSNTGPEELRLIVIEVAVR